MVLDDANSYHLYSRLPPKYAIYFNAISIVIQQTILAWRYVYLLGSVMFLIFAIVWQIFGSSEVQPWDSYWAYERNTDYTRIEDTSKSEEKTMENDEDVY